jgi:5-methylcytosine-specific restriction protein A
MASDKASAFTPEVKELIYRRAKGRCDRCGLPVNGMHFHHRNPRRMGGSDNIALGLPSNGLLLHPLCHDVIESKRKISAELGFILGVAQDPMEWPVYLWSGWALLNEDGTMLKMQGVPPLGPVDAKALRQVDGV